MTGIIEALLSAVVTREIDMAECDEMYAGVKLPVRVNWPRAWKKKRFALSKEHFAIRDELAKCTGGDDIDPTVIDDLNKRAREITGEFDLWWSGVLLMTVDEKIMLQNAMPDPHWDWLLARIVKRVNVYEVEETKKALVLRGLSSTEPARKCPNCGTDLPSPDG